MRTPGASAAPSLRPARSGAMVGRNRRAAIALSGRAVADVEKLIIGTGDVQQEVQWIFEPSRRRAQLN